MNLPRQGSGGFVAVGLGICLALGVTERLMAQTEAERVLLICTDVPEAVCAAVTEALARRADPRPVLRARQAGAGEPWVELRVETASATRLAGRLVWPGPDGKAIEGPLFETVVSDATVSDSVRRQFAATLVEHSGLPF